jgi:hypothetical protein
MSVMKIGAAAAAGGLLGGVDVAAGAFADLLAESLENDKAKQEQASAVGTGDGIAGNIVLIGAVDAGTSADNSPSDSAAEEAKQMLHDMTAGGLDGFWKWHIKQLREKITDEVMQGMGITKDSLAAMPAEQRMAVEKAINDEVEKRLKEALAKELEKGKQAADATAGAAEAKKAGDIAFL